MSARRVSRLGIVATAFVALVAVGVALAGPTHAQAATTTEACANPDCHSWGPGPDPSVTAPVPVADPGSTAVAPTPAVVEPPTVAIGMGRPTVHRVARSSRRVVVRGTLGASHLQPSTVVLELSRKSGSKYGATQKVVVAVSPGADSFRASVKLARRGTWRVRVVHADTAHLRSASGYCRFVVR